MNEAVKNQLPSVTDVMFIAGICMLATGISFHWGWPIACQVVGTITVTLAIVAKLRGHN